MNNFKNPEIENLEIVQIHEFKDLRGTFKKVFDQKKLESIIQRKFSIRQLNISSNNHKGTVRGMHFQRSPFQEAKIIFCTKGRINDVVIDLRPNSSTFLNIKSIILSEDNNELIFVPAGCAHGYQSLTDNSEIIYLSDNFYDVASESGVNPMDPRISSYWSIPISQLSERDSHLPRFDEIKP